MRPHLLVETLMAVVVPAALAAQTPAPPAKGPVVADFGAVYVVPNPGLPTPMLQALKIRFDVSETPADVTRPPAVGVSAGSTPRGAAVKAFSR